MPPVFAALMILGISHLAFALPAPPRPLDALAPGWTEINLKVDLRNLTGADDVGKVREEELTSKLVAANNVWSQCSLKFTARSVSNVSALQLGIPYAPRSQDDLSKIASALNPHGFDAIPLTVAGPWNFYDGGAQLFLTGLGWVFTKESGIDRIGAMISSTKLSDPAAGPIIAHELAHALSLPHTSEKVNLMGEAGTNNLTLGQCLQARKFSEIALKDFLIGS